MGKFDEILENYTAKKKEYNKEEYSEYKRKEKQEVYDMIDKTAEKIVTNGNEFKKYLDSQSKFDSYSVGNALLVMAQMPKAIQLKDYDGWQKVGAYPKRSYKKVKILEPGSEYMREDGSIGVNYDVKYVCDVSQVYPKQRINNMRYNEKILMKIFLSGNQAKYKIVDEIPNTDKGSLYDFNEDVLYIARGAEPPFAFYDLTQEIAKQEIGEGSDLEKFKAYCVSYMLCKKYNVDVSGFKFDQVPEELKNMGAKEIREELEPIRNAMESINARMNLFVRNIMKENRNKGNKVKENVR